MSRLLQRPKLVTSGASPRDGVPDMTVISDIDEYGINTNLKVRYKKNDIYTYTGTILVAVNPYYQLGIYEQDTITKYAGKKMSDVPPHVFATAEAALTYLQDQRKNQSCIISGESGAGKTETTKFILQYLCAVTCSVTRWVEQQILEANTVLEAFGNAKTVRNDNSSRFGKFIQVCFDRHNQISGCIIQDYLLELSRVSFQSSDERNYHIFYQMVAGAMKSPELRGELLLEKASSFTYLNQSGCYSLDGVDDAAMFDQLRLALQVLNVSTELSAGIFRILSAILWIGNLEFEDSDSEACQLAAGDLRVVGKVAKLLGLSEAQVRKVCTIRQISVKGTTTDIALKYHEARENRHAMAKALYSRTFTWLVNQINSCTNPGTDASRFIGVLDIFGFENFTWNSFEQLCINYTNEKLHKFFNHYVFALEQEIYKEEGITYSHISFTDNSLCLDLIEKPPKCVLRLLDEECRFPRGTDQSFLEKLHHEMGSHRHFVKGEDKRKWAVQFGIQHYAGPVTYHVRNFLDKNKDVQQEIFFDFLEHSSCEFARDITKYRDMLTTYLETAKKKATKSKSLISGTRTGKGKPTVGDTFRTQLLALVDVLDMTTPWYVRCLKPNNDKASMEYEDDLIITQLRYSGMLDIVRIRKEGYPVHVPASEFLDKYRCLAAKDPEPLPADDKKAVARILRSLKLPETEWQIGKRKIFLRNTVFDPLETKRKQLLAEQIVVIQRVWRGYHARKRYLLLRWAAIVLQKHFRGSRLRIQFVRKRRAAITIQAHMRGMWARDLAEALRKKRAEEEAERRRKRRLEEERLSKARAEKSMEESYKAAQMELLTLAKMAEHKSQKAVSKTGQVDLDQMFEFLADQPKPLGPDEQKFLKSITADLEVMFQEAQVASEPVRKVSRPAPQPPAQTGNGITRTQQQRLSRTQRRQRRVVKKLLGVEERVERFDPSAYPLIKFAEMYYNDHPKDTGGFSTLSLRRSPKVKDPITKSEMLVFTKSTSLPTSLVHMHDPENVNLACGIFKDLCKLLRGDWKLEQCNLTIQSTIAYGIERPELRDEIFCQLIRQVSDNPRDEAVMRGWHFLTLCTIAFPPSKNFNKYLQAFFHANLENRIIGRYASACLRTMRLTKVSARKLSPSTIEIAAVKHLNPLICRFYFLDGKAKAMGVDPSSPASEVIKSLAEKIDLQSVDGWALYEVNPEREHFIKGHEYIADILSQWEQDRRSSMVMTKYTTVSKKPSYTAALGGGDSKFVFRKRVFHRPKEIPEDPVEYHLMYAQAVHSVVKIDEFPVNEAVALQLAGLQAQVLFGDHAPSITSRYDEIEQFLATRIVQGNRAKTREDWKRDIEEAHKKYGTGKTVIQAKVWYLTSVKYYPLYGSTFFYVHYKGFWSYPNHLIVAVDLAGVKFVNQKSKQIMAEYKYAQLESVAVDIVDDAVTLNMRTSGPEEQRSFNFETHQKEDIANLIASYSPVHSNWQRVGEAKTKLIRASEEDRAKLWQEVWGCRRMLAVEHKMLQEPPDKGNFLTTTLRKYNRARLERLRKAREEKDFEKIFKPSFWSYSKSMLKQPISVLEGEKGDELEDTALRLFFTIQQHAGITPSSGSGFEEVEPEDCITMVQLAIQKCLEKESLCNEFYLQLVKQTTDQPDPNGRINIQNWRFLSLIAGIVVPRNRVILSYLQAHLRRCGIDSHTEEGKYAQFCMQCLNRTIQTKNRKYPPSYREVQCIIRRRPIHERFYFMDGQFRAIEFDASATTEEVVCLVKERIGLQKDSSGFSLFEVFGQLERNMLPQEKVADAMFKWEKYARSTHSPKSLKLTFKKRLFTKPYMNPNDPVEFNLLLHQVKSLKRHRNYCDN